MIYHAKPTGHVYHTPNPARKPAAQQPAPAPSTQRAAQPAVNQPAQNAPAIASPAGGFLKMPGAAAAFPCLSPGLAAFAASLKPAEAPALPTIAEREARDQRIKDLQLRGLTPGTAAFAADTKLPA